MEELMPGNNNETTHEEVKPWENLDSELDYSIMSDAPSSPSVFWAIMLCAILLGIWNLLNKYSLRREIAFVLSQAQKDQLSTIPSFDGVQPGAKVTTPCDETVLVAAIKGRIAIVSDPSNGNQKEYDISLLTLVKVAS